MNYIFTYKRSEGKQKNSLISIKKTVVYLLVLSFLMCFSGFSMSAVTDDEYFAGNQLKQIGVLKGYLDGSLKLDQPIVRSEVATIMVRIRGYENKVINLEGKEFIDIKADFWAYSNIQNAFKLTLIQGYPDSSFKPNNNITYAEVVTIVVNALGYKDSMQGEWPTNYLERAKELAIIPKTPAVDPNKIITRGEMALIIWDTLLVLVENKQILN